MPRADRLIALAQLLAGPTRRTLGDLTERLETSARSIYRDLADLEARGFAIDRSEGGYRLLDEGSLRTMPLTARERLVLALALESPALEAQEVFRNAVRAVRAKLTRAGDHSVALSGPDRTGRVPESVTIALEQAIERRHSVSLLYISLSSGRRAWRGIDPWGLVHRSEAWYLIGRCHVHDEPRTFRLDRVDAVLPIGGSFGSPRFDAAAWFASSWGVERQDEALDLHIVFEAAIAPLIERARYHPLEEKTPRRDGRLDYHVRVTSIDEVARWIVGFGGAAVLVSPPEVVARVQQIASGAARAHAPRSMLRSARRVTLRQRD